MGKKSKAPTVEITQQERALAEVSAQKWDRYKELYRPVESQYIQNASRDATRLLRGRNIADVQQASAGSFGDAVALGLGGAGQLGTTAENMGAARTLAATGGEAAAQIRKDQGRLNALKIGNDMAADAQSGLAMAARASNTEALGRARSQSIKNEAKSEAISSVAGMLGGAYMDKKRPEWALQMDKPLRDRKG